jgi:hypothetical protein
MGATKGVLPANKGAEHSAKPRIVQTRILLGVRAIFVGMNRKVYATEFGLSKMLYLRQKASYNAAYVEF